MKLKEVQDRLYDLLCLVDDICRKENVPYFLDGGTELGAVREKDIIAWDDDMDIKILMKDYPAFRAAMEKHLPEHVHLIEPDAFAPGFFDFILRIQDDRWLIREETEEDRYYHNMQNRVGIDLCFLFGVPGGKLAQTLTYYRLKLIYGLGMGHRYKKDYTGMSFAEKTGVAIFSAIGKRIPVPVIWKHFYKVINKLDKRCDEYVWCNLLNRESIIRKEWMTGSVEGELRGRKFPVPAGYDKELTSYYGDYMTPPRDIGAYRQHLDEKDRYTAEENNNNAEKE